jgi:hypothetical protein
MAEQGCLLGYGPNLAELWRRNADYVARIFRGTPPGPLGIAIPPAILARARTSSSERPERFAQAGGGVPSQPSSSTSAIPS